jgi:ADP-heptose:LPS heptosyltransferase
LEKRGMLPVVVPGPGDEAFTAAMQALYPDLVVAPKTNLLEMKDLLARMAVHVGTDNGSRHLAASLRVPTVTVFGPTSAEGWNQQHPDHVSVALGLDCQPCDLKECPIPGHPCLEELSADRVADAVTAVLKTKSEQP